MSTDSPEKDSRPLRRSLMLRMDDEQPTEQNRIRVVASTDDPCDMGYAEERLMHDEKCIDRDGAASVLFNHDTDQVIGRIVSTAVKGGRMNAELEIDPEVRGTNGLPLLKAIRNGYIKGVSIGYDYGRADCVLTENENGRRTITVNRWTLREISLTPTPADLAAGVQRSAPNWLADAISKVRAKEDTTMSFEEWLQKRGLRMADLSAETLAALRRDYDAEAKRASASANAPVVNEVQKEREARETAERNAADANLRAELLELAASHGVKLSEERTKELLKCKSIKDGANLLMRWKGEDSKPADGQPGGSSVIVSRDVADKADEAAIDGLMFMAGQKQEKDLGMRSNSFQQIGRRWLEARGVRQVLNMDKSMLAGALLGKGPGERAASQMFTRDAANVTSGHFASYLLVNAADKLVYGGFNQNDSVVTYPIWCKERKVADFKTYYGAALDVGNLVESAENTAFPELLKEEGGYSDALSMWGATVSLTFQAIVNDDLGQFMEKLGMAGFIAKRTIDKKVYSVVENATWTNRTTAGNLADTQIDILRANMAAITGAAGEVLGLVPRYLIVPAGLRSKALQITQVAPYIAPTEVKIHTDLIPVVTPFLTTKTTGANSEFYLACEKMFDPCVVATLDGIDSPVIEEYDAGAVACRKWKIMMPFKVTVPTVASKVQAMWNDSGT